MKFGPILILALVGLFPACVSQQSQPSSAQSEATRSARQLMAAESYQQRMTTIRSAHRYWGPQEYGSRRDEIDSARALLLNSVYSD